MTDANLNYEGSITIDSDLLKLSGILPYEMVQVYNIHTGARIETYAIEGDPGSGTICLNGAAARLFAPGDLIIIISFVLMEQRECETFHPTIILVDAQNRPAICK